MKGIDFKKQVAINTANTLKNNKLISSENVKKNLLVLPELKEFIPSLSAEEYKSLEDLCISKRHLLMYAPTKYSHSDFRSFYLLIPSKQMHRHK